MIFAGRGNPEWLSGPGRGLGLGKQGEECSARRCYGEQVPHRPNSSPRPSPRKIPSPLAGEGGPKGRVRGDSPLGCLGRALELGEVEASVFEHVATRAIFPGGSCEFASRPIQVLARGLLRQGFGRSSTAGSTPEGGAVPCVARCDPVGGDEALRLGVRHRLADGRIPQAGPCSLLAVPLSLVTFFGEAKKVTSRRATPGRFSRPQGGMDLTN